VDAGVDRAPNEAPEPQKCELLAEWAAARKLSDIPPEHLPYLKALVLDSLGCAIGALHGTPAVIASSVSEELGGRGQCTAIGLGRTAADRATFVNGALVRYLDFMDIFMVEGQTFHPSDNFAATLAAAELAGATGADFLTALAVAYQVQARFSELAPLQEKHFDHVTHLAFSIPAAATRAMGLDTRRGANSIALCASSINTLWTVRTGRLSNWKGIASAQAAMSCMHMTLLAAHGMTGPLDVMEGAGGWEETIGDPVDVDWRKEPLDGFTRSSVKRFNAEAHTQSTIECILELRQRHGIDPLEVERVEVEVFKQANNIVGGGDAGDRTIVRSKEQADHSIPYLAAVALLDGDVWPAQLTSGRVTSHDVQSLLQRVWVRQRDDLSRRYPAEMPCRVTILMKDGRRLGAEKNDYAGFWRTRPFDWEDVVAKFERLAGPMLDPGLRREIPDAVDDLETLPVAELTRLLARIETERRRATA